MTDTRDRLYELLPAIYRIRDAEQGYALRGLLRVIAEQVDLVEADIGRLYENWFIETCDDWVVPYIGDLLGYRQINEAGEPSQADTPAARRRNRVLIPRRDVANTIRSRRRRGTLAVLEQLAADVAGWPARAVEFYAQVARTQSVAASQPGMARSADLRDMAGLELAGGPFGALAHSVDVRRVSAPRDPGRYNIPSVGLFVWRLRAYPLTQTGALRIDKKSNHFTFSLLGNDTQLYTRARPETDPTQIAGPLNLPIPITRAAFERDKAAYYGEGKSLAIYRAPGRPPIPIDDIIVADLSDWKRYRTPPGKVAVDPELGRIVFNSREKREELRNLLVSYFYGFSADIGGGEYERPLSQNTVAFALARSDHLREPDKLLQRLHNDRGPLADELRRRMDPELRQLLEDYIGGKTDADSEASLLRLLLAYLNRVLQGPSLYSYEHLPFLAVEARLPDADADTREAWRLAREEPRGPRLLRLNRLILQRHFADELALSYRYYPVVARPDEPGRPSALAEALEQWATDKPRNALIEILDSADYTQPVVIRLGPGQTLELRAGDRCRPAIRLLNYMRSEGDELRVVAEPGSRITFDGIMVTGHGVRVEGDPAAVHFRHCTLVPGWELEAHCRPLHGEQASLVMADKPPADDESQPPRAPGASRPRTRLFVERSIIGSIAIQRDAVGKDPLEITISDSILDATDAAGDALSDINGGTAHAVLTVLRSTVIGEICTHAIELAENAIFYGKLRVARSQRGCMRFCSVVPGSRTPRRFNCQPDLAEQAAAERLRRQGELSGGVLKAAIAAEQEHERLRVRPQFRSTRYGEPSYGRLDDSCAREISAGADDESEMGVFHHLFAPQRSANLRVRLAEYAVSDMEAAVIFVD